MTRVFVFFFKKKKRKREREKEKEKKKKKKRKRKKKRKGTTIKNQLNVHVMFCEWFMAEVCCVSTIHMPHVTSMTRKGSSTMNVRTNENVPTISTPKMFKTPVL